MDEEPYPEDGAGETREREEEEELAETVRIRSVGTSKVYAEEEEEAVRGVREGPARAL